ncbi:MAG: alpha/beta hydrolase, partial [Alistipes sp.]|nr:alpha/beta hydrolase [Alistipes sp.]
MKKTFSLIILSLLAIGLSAQDIAGSWLGTLDMGPSQMRLVFNITAGDRGYSGTLDSPDQGVKGLPLSEVDFNGSQLKVTVSALGVTYTGEVNPEITRIEGTFKQGLYELPLYLGRGTVTFNRPQEPKPPYTYRR